MQDRPSQGGTTPQNPPRRESDITSTRELLDLARTGDQAALELLCRKYVPRLRRWAAGRLPERARGLLDTDDLVQDTLLRTIKRIQSPKSGPVIAFHSYLRRAIHNRIVDEIRRPGRLVAGHPIDSEVGGEPVTSDPSPLEEAIGAEAYATYERALETLAPGDREAIVGRIEMGCSYAELAETLGKPSPDAARMVVCRAVVRLAQEMGFER